MSDESTSNELDRDVDASMRMFEKSQVGPAAVISPIRPSRILVVLDGSSQDDASIASAKYLRDQFNVESVMLDARIPTIGEDASQANEDLAAKRTSEVSGSRPIGRGEGDAHDVIVASVIQHDVDLVIVPSPFGRRFDEIGSDSVGTVMDVLLSRCPKPILVTRRDDQTLAQCSQSIRFIVSSECDVEMRAAAWAFGLLSEGGIVTLNLVVEKEQYENIRSIIEALDPEQTLDEEKFADALTKTHQKLHAAMAKSASAGGITYHLRPQAGEIAPPNPLNDSVQQLLVMPLEVDDRFTQGFVQNRIRRSPHPVLVVPGHVPADA